MTIIEQVQNKQHEGIATPRASGQARQHQAAGNKGPFWQQFSEKYHTLRTLSAHRSRGLQLDFDMAADRYIILADVHRGEGDPLTDDFYHNEATYLDALRYYLDGDFRLVLNGDIEECWKSDIHGIIDRYYDTAYALEREFVKKGPGFYLRTFGNHDDDFEHENVVKAYLRPALGDSVRVFPSIALGKHITIAHGHQGDLTSDRIKNFSRQIVRRVWRPLQERFGASQDLKQAQNNPIKTPRDRSLKHWASQSHQLLIASHTHRALFHPNGEENNHHYINTGACVHHDGLTAIELDRGEIRLVRWQQPSQAGMATREIVQSGDLGRMIAHL